MVSEPKHASFATADLPDASCDPNPNASIILCLVYAMPKRNSRASPRSPSRVRQGRLLLMDQCDHQRQLSTWRIVTSHYFHMYIRWVPFPDFHDHAGLSGEAQ